MDPTDVLNQIILPASTSILDSSGSRMPANTSDCSRRTTFTKFYSRPDGVDLTVTVEKASEARANRLFKAIAKAHRLKERDPPPPGGTGEAILNSVAFVILVALLTVCAISVLAMCGAADFISQSKEDLISKWITRIALATGVLGALCFMIHGVVAAIRQWCESETEHPNIRDTA